MRIISRRALYRCWTQHPPARAPLLAWYDFVRRQKWRVPSELRAAFRSADFVGGNRVIFDIGGNRFRLVAEINFKNQCLFVRYVGTHQEYDRIDARTVKQY